MPGFISRISAYFSKPASATTPAQEPRLLNLPSTETQNDVSDQISARDLEGNFFCWLLGAPSQALGKELDSCDQQIIDALGRRINQQSLEELPRQPHTLPMLMRALSDENADRKELADIILSDPALTDQMLHVANSPLFRVNDTPIESVSQAIFMIGLDGIRNIISAAVMRPMMAARNSREALFAQRVWRWGLTCAQSAELIAKLRNQDGSVYFLTGLLPALSYLTLRRELLRICRAAPQPCEPSSNLIHQALSRYQWATAQVLANAWKLPPKYNARLLEAERPAPQPNHSPLNDGIIIGTREILRHAHQKNMAEEDLMKLIHIEPAEFTRVRRTILDSIEAGSKA